MERPDQGQRQEHRIPNLAEEIKETIEMMKRMAERREIVGIPPIGSPPGIYHVINPVTGKKETVIIESYPRMNIEDTYKERNLVKELEKRLWNAFSRFAPHVKPHYPENVNEIEKGLEKVVSGYYAGYINKIIETARKCLENGELGKAVRLMRSALNTSKALVNKIFDIYTEGGKKIFGRATGALNFVLHKLVPKLPEQFRDEIKKYAFEKFAELTNKWSIQFMGKKAVENPQAWANVEMGKQHLEEAKKEMFKNIGKAVINVRESLDYYKQAIDSIISSANIRNIGDVTRVLREIESEVISNAPQQFRKELEEYARKRLRAIMEKVLPS